jgi:hypothetical protein
MEPVVVTIYSFLDTLGVQISEGGTLTGEHF